MNTRRKNKRPRKHGRKTRSKRHKGGAGKITDYFPPDEPYNKQQANQMLLKGAHDVDLTTPGKPSMVNHEYA